MSLFKIAIIRKLHLQMNKINKNLIIFILSKIGQFVLKRFMLLRTRP